MIYQCIPITGWGICIITHPFLTMFYPLLQLQFSFFRSFFFLEVSVNDDIAVKLIVVFVLGSAFVKKSTPGMCSTFICWTRIEAKRNAFSIRPSFGILLAEWRFFIYSFSFENYESDIDRVIYLRSCIVTFC